MARRNDPSARPTADRAVRRAVKPAEADTRRRPSEEVTRLQLDGLMAVAAPELAGAPRALLVAGVQAFAEHGYAATTTRDIASRAGMSPAALYVHYPSKESLLFAAIRFGHEQALNAVRDAVRRAGEDSGDRVRAFVRAFSYWHARQSTLARVAQDELDALTSEHFAVVAGLRRETEGLLRNLIAEGAAAGAFAPLEVPGTTVALLSLGIDVARWFPHAADRTPDDVGDLYAELAVRMLRSPETPTT